MPPTSRHPPVAPDWMGLQCGPDTRNFKNSLGDSNMWPSSRTTAFAPVPQLINDSY